MNNKAYNVKDYLGDSVYATVDESGDVVLTTENGFGPSNTIYLDESVLNNLLRYIERVKAEKEHAKKMLDAMENIRCNDRN